MDNESYLHNQKGYASVQRECSCGCEWHVELIQELGTWFAVSEDDEKCPECGKDWRME